jgi:hypothetical protein
VSYHYVVITKSEAGEFALYEGIENTLNKDTERGVVLRSTDARGAVDMVLFYGRRRKAVADKKVRIFDDFEAAIIKPYPKYEGYGTRYHGDVYAGVVTVQDWRLFSEIVHARNTRGNNMKAIRRLDKVWVNTNDLRRLRHGEKLNCNIMNFFFHLLQKRDWEIMGGRSLFFNTYWLAVLGGVEKRSYNYDGVKRWHKDVDIFELDRLFIPVNQEQAHWTFMLVEIQSREIYYFDSMEDGGRYKDKCVETVTKFLQDEWRDKKGKISKFKWKVGKSKFGSVPQQENGIDCGVFACAFAESISRGRQSFGFKQEDITALRLQIALSILDTEHFRRFFCRHLDV